MAIEEQILNFVVQVTDKAATTTAKAIAGGFEFMKKAVSAVTGHTKALAGPMTKIFDVMKSGTKVIGGVGAGGLIGGIVGTGGALGLLTTGVTKALYSWGKFHISMLEFRKQTGMSRAEMTEFNLQVIDAARQYGVQMSRVGDIARMVAYGTTKSREGIAKMAGELAQFSQVTGVSTEATAQLGEMLSNTARMGPEEIRRLTYGIKKISDVNAPADKVTEVLNQVGTAVGKLPLSMRKHFIEQVPAFASSLIKTGMGVSQVSGLISEMADATSIAGKRLDASGGDFDAFRRDMNNMTVGARENQYSIRALEDRYHITAEAITGLALSTKEATEVNTKWVESQKKTTSEIESDMRALMTPMEKLHSAWQRVEGAIGHAAEKIMPAFEPALNWLASAIDKAADYWTGPGSFLDKLEKGIAEVGRRVGEETGMTKGMAEEGGEAFGGAFANEFFGRISDIAHFRAAFFTGRRYDIEAATEAKYKTVQKAKTYLPETEFRKFMTEYERTGKFPSYKGGHVEALTTPRATTSTPPMVPIGPAMPVSAAGMIPEQGPTTGERMMCERLDKQLDIMKKPELPRTERAQPGAGAPSGLGIEAIPLVR